MMEILQYILYIGLALLILLVMITIHEFGHYLAGKLLKFKINEFSIGFGPKLFSKKLKNGEVFSIRAVPLGGFCAFDGEEYEEEKGENAKSVPVEVKETVTEINPDLKKFNDQAPWKRIIVLISGGFFNILSAVIFSFIFIWAVGLTVPQVTYLSKDANGQIYAVDVSGEDELQIGDIIVAVNGERITYLKSFGDLGRTNTTVFTVLRDGNEIELTLLTKKIIAQEEIEGSEESEGFGFSIGTVALEGSFIDALINAVPYTGKMAWTVLGALGQLITGKVALTEVTGPIGTITTMAEVSIMNWRNILMLLPLLAANLGVFNLLPIPALDGSKIVFGIIEWIRKKPIDRKIETMIHFVGLVVLFAFVIFVDIFGIFARCTG